MMLRARLRVMLAVTFVGIAVLATAVVVPYQRRETRRSIEKARLQLRFVAAQLDRGLVDLLFQESTRGAIPPRLERLVRETDVAVAAVYSPDGTLAASAPPSQALASKLDEAALGLLQRDKKPIRRETEGPVGWSVEYYHPLLHAGQPQGYLYLVQSLAATERQERLVLWGTGALLAGLLLVLFALTGAFLRRAVVDRLARLATLMKRAVEAELHVRWESSGRDEIASIGHSFNSMVEGLREREFIKTTFGSYVSPEVVRRLLEGGEQVVSGQRRTITVLFSDIRRFTTMSEQMQPEEVVALLNDYMERMTGAIAARGGRVDKFIGDAIMAEWGALENVAQPEMQAVGAAVEMSRALARLNEERRAAGRPELEIGIGLNNGEVVAGTVGSSKKLEFTVIGDTVNLASRLEGLCGTYGASIIASDTVWEKVRGEWPGRELDHVIVKGKGASTRLYEVLAPEDPRVARLPRYARGMEHYRARRFAEARAELLAAGDGLTDPVCAFQVERCERFIAEPPPPDWDGVERRGK
jgi:class 3 adenylate cyclase